jgi:hypothetical protein
MALFRWIFVEGRTDEEIRKTLGVSSQVYRSRKSRLCARVRKAFREMRTEPPGPGGKNLGPLLFLCALCNDTNNLLTTLF